MNSKFFITLNPGLFFLITTLAPLNAQPKNLAEFGSYCLSNCESGRFQPTIKELNLCAKYCDCQVKKHSDIKSAELKEQQIRRLIDTNTNPYLDTDFMLASWSCVDALLIENAVGKIKNKK